MSISGRKHTTGTCQLRAPHEHLHLRGRRDLNAVDFVIRELHWHIPDFSLGGVCPVGASLRPHHSDQGPSPEKLVRHKKGECKRKKGFHRKKPLFVDL